MLQKINFDCSFQSSLDQFSEETFDELEDGVNRYFVSKTLSFKGLILTFLLELMEVKKHIRCFMRSCSQKDKQSFRGYQYATKD